MLNLKQWECCAILMLSNAMRADRDEIEGKFSWEGDECNQFWFSGCVAAIIQQVKISSYILGRPSRVTSSFFMTLQGFDAVKLHILS